MRKSHGLCKKINVEKLRLKGRFNKKNIQAQCSSNMEITLIVINFEQYSIKLKRRPKP